MSDTLGAEAALVVMPMGLTSIIGADATNPPDACKSVSVRDITSGAEFPCVAGSVNAAHAEPVQYFLVDPSNRKMYLMSVLVPVVSDMTMGALEDHWEKPGKDVFAVVGSS